MSINFDELRDKAVEAAQTAAQKTRDLAAIAKAKVSILAEEEKIRKAQMELGKLYYRDYVLGEDMDSAEYLPWCDKITACRAVIEDLKDLIDEIRTGDVGDPADAEAADYADCAALDAPKSEE